MKGENAKTNIVVKNDTIINITHERLYWGYIQQ